MTPRRESMSNWSHTRVFLSSWYSLILLHEFSLTHPIKSDGFARSLFDILPCVFKSNSTNELTAKPEAGEKKSTYAPWLCRNGERQTSCKKLTFWNGRTLRALQREWDRLRLLSHKVEYHEIRWGRAVPARREYTECKLQNN